MTRCTQTGDPQHYFGDQHDHHANATINRDQPQTKVPIWVWDVAPRQMSLGQRFQLLLEGPEQEVSYPKTVMTLDFEPALVDYETSKILLPGFSKTFTEADPMVDQFSPGSGQIYLNVTS